MNSLDVNKIANELKNKSTIEIVEWAINYYKEDLGFMTALGSSGIVLLHHALKISKNIQPYFIDTGFHFNETMELLNKVQKFWKIEFQVLKPVISDNRLNELIGEKPWETNPDICCHYRKVDPLLRVIHTKEIWMSALRRDQSTARAKLEVLELDGRGTLKIYPLVHWSYEEVWQYIRDNNLFYNELHDKNYPSLGCTHCTSPTKKGEHERSGRWNSMPKLECGIHVNNLKKR